METNSLTVEQKIEEREESNNSIDKATRRMVMEKSNYCGFTGIQCVTDEFCFDFRCKCFCKDIAANIMFCTASVD